MESVDRLRKLGNTFTPACRGYGPREQIADIADAIEAEVAERYTELPRDADGVPIRVGDTVYGEDGKEWRVTYLRIGSGHSVAATDGSKSRELRPGWLTHHKPPTVEGVLWGLMDFARGYEGEPTDADWYDELAAAAAKLRLAEGGDAS